MIKNLNKSILFVTIILVIIGVMTFFSASIVYLKDPNQFLKIFLIQILAIIFGFIGIYIIQKSKKINYLTIKNNSFYFFILSILLQFLVLVPYFGVARNGALRWVDIGPLTIQPSEILRFFTILFVANIFFVFKKELRNFNTFLKISLPFVAIVGSFYFYIHDLGSLVILFFTLAVMLLFTSVDKLKLILYSLLSVILLLVSAWFVSDHARERLNTFIHPENHNITGDYFQNYHMLRAVGSGRVLGVGYGGSMQKFNGNIPEAISDSIFAVYAEEWGFLGSVFLILLYLTLSFLIFVKIKKIKNEYQRLVIVGLGTNLIFPAFYNIAVAVDLVPMSGIPLTFISKGGTSIFLSLLSIGIILLFYKK